MKEQTAWELRAHACASPAPQVCSHVPERAWPASLCELQCAAAAADSHILQHESIPHVPQEQVDNQLLVLRGATQHANQMELNVVGEGQSRGKLTVAALC
jgi:hypothetical protein